MPRYVIMPERCRFYLIDAADAETAYRGVCCWYPAKKPVAVMDSETGETVIFTRQLDRDGNLDQLSKGWPG